MKIGFAKVSITPALPRQLAGYAKKRIAYDVLDDVYVKVMVLSIQEKRYGIVSYDVCAIDSLLIEEVKKECAKQGLGEMHLLFTATHTHSSFGGLIDTIHGVNRVAEEIFVTTDKQLIKEVAEKSVKAIVIACEDLQEGTLSIAKTQVHDIGNNRNNVHFPGNDDMTAMFAEQRHGRRSIITNFACHPTVLNDQNLSISADYPGAIDAHMIQQGYVMNLFLNGSCGDISTRYSRHGVGYEEVQRYGALCKNALVDLAKQATPMDIDHIDWKTFTWSLNMKKPDDIPHAKEALELQERLLLKATHQGVQGSELRLQESFVEGAQANLRHAISGLHQEFCEVEVTIIRMNKETFVCIPGELFSELSNPLQTAHIHFIGYANGYLGYFADQKAYKNRCYEALSSPFEEGEGEKLMKYIEHELI